MLLFCGAAVAALACQGLMPAAAAVAHRVYFEQAPWEIASWVLGTGSVLMSRSRTVGGQWGCACPGWAFPVDPAFCPHFNMAPLKALGPVAGLGLWVPMPSPGEWSSVG